MTGTHRVTFVILALLFAAQLALPVSMIARYESTLRTGELFRVRCAPVDPVDAFRGRYVAIGLQPGMADDLEVQSSRLRGGDFWITLEEGPDGFAQAVAATEKPPAGDAYLQGSVRATWQVGEGGTSVQVHRITLPFDRYYMRETLAPEVERALWSRRPSGESPAWVALRVRSGVGAIEQLYIDDTPAEDFLERAAEGTQPTGSTGSN